MALLLELQEIPGDIEHGQAVQGYFGKHLLSLLSLLLVFAPFSFFTVFLCQTAFLGQLTPLGLILLPFLLTNMADWLWFWWGNNRNTETFLKFTKPLAQLPQREIPVHAGCLDRGFPHIDDSP